MFDGGIKRQLEERLNEPVVTTALMLPVGFAAHTRFVTSDVGGIVLLWRAIRGQSRTFGQDDGSTLLTPGPRMIMAVTTTTIAWFELERKGLNDQLSTRPIETVPLGSIVELQVTGRPEQTIKTVDLVFADGHRQRFESGRGRELVALATALGIATPRNVTPPRSRAERTALIVLPLLILLIVIVVVAKYLSIGGL